MPRKDEHRPPNLAGREIVSFLLRIAYVGALSLLGILWLWLELCTAGEVALHTEHDEAVVTLVDQDRRDPEVYRWVLVVSLDQASSTLVDRDRGRVLVCVGKARTREIRYEGGVPKLRLGDCVLVFDGPVRPKGQR